MRGGKVFTTSSKWQRPKEVCAVTIRSHDPQTKQETENSFTVECTRAELPALYSSIVSRMMEK